MFSRFKLEFLLLVVPLIFIKGCHNEQKAGGGVEVGNAYESTNSDALNPAAPLAEVNLGEENHETQVLRLYPDGRLEATTLDHQRRAIDSPKSVPDAGPGLTARFIPIGRAIQKAVSELRLPNQAAAEDEKEDQYFISDESGQRQSMEMASEALEQLTVSRPANQVATTQVTLQDLHSFGQFLKQKVVDFRDRVSSLQCAKSIAAQALAY